MRITSRAEIIIAIAIIAIIALGMIFVLIVPQFGVMADQDRQLEQANQDMQSAKNLLAQRQSAKAQAAKTQADLMALENQVPDDPQLPALIIGLQNTANEAGLEFVKITPGALTTREGYSAVPVSVNLSGRWSDCVDYVHRLEKFDRQVRVLSIKLLPTTSQSASVEATSADADLNPPVDLNATIQLEAYSIPAGASTGTSP
jgi:type IV pilus assembly protein PilO